LYNKTNSAVQLKHLPTGLVIKCQSTRSRDSNRKTARRILAEKLEERDLGDQSRVVIKRNEVARKKASRKKKSLRKYRALAADRKEDAEEGVEDVEEGVAEMEFGISEQVDIKGEGFIKSRESVTKEDAKGKGDG